MTRALTTIAACAVAGCAAGPLPQEPRDPRVVVTAQKREQPPADVPRSVTALTAEQLRDAGVRTVEEAARFVPNTLVTGFTARRLSFPFVRGVGSGQGDPAVATFVDGVPQLTVSSTALPLVGIERIEFLRGPYGSLWGRNTLGGAIHMLTAPPASRAGVDAGAAFGNFASQEYDVSLDAPVGEELAVSVDGLYATRDGYTTNAFTGNDVDARDGLFGRLQLQWTPDEDTSVRLIVHGERARDGGFALADLDGLRREPNRIDQDFEGATSRDLVAGSLLWNEYGTDVDFVSITSAQGWEIDESADFDFSPLDAVRRFTSEEQDYIYQELRLASPRGAGVDLGGDAELAWLAGASGFASDARRAAANEFRPGGSGIAFPPGMVGTDRAQGDFDDWSLSAFGQASLLLGGRWELTAALRYDRETKEAAIDRGFESGGIVVPTASSRQQRTFDEWLPRASAGYRAGDHVRCYALAARGFKAGGFNLTAPAGSEAFGPETSWTYEAGVKTEWLERKLAASFAVFRVDWDDMQLSQFDANAGGYVTNAGESTSHGIEVEVAAQPLAGLTLFGSFGWLATEFEAYVDQFGQDVAGNSLPFAPDTTLGAGGQYERALTAGVAAFARVDFFHTGEFFYDAGNRESERYALTDFRIGARGDNWRLDGWLANAFDERWVPIAFQPDPADPSAFVGESAAPRTWGVSLRIVF